MSSRIGYAGLVLATGLGWLLLLDLSAHAHRTNRYLALYHQGHLWLGLLVFSLLLFLRRPLAHGLAWSLSIAGEAARAASQRLGAAGAAASSACSRRWRVLGFGFAFANMRQLTSEIWARLADRRRGLVLLPSRRPAGRAAGALGPAGIAFWRYVWPLVLVVGVLIGAMVLTRDMGPLLIAGYASGAFLAASVAMWWHLRSGQRWTAFILAVGLFGAVDRRRHLGPLRARLGRRRRRRASREPGGTVRLGQRPARARHLVPAGGAGAGIRPRRRAVVRLRACRPLRRRAGADPQRLHLHRDRRRVRRRRGLDGGARLRALAAPADPPPRPGHPRRAAAGGARRPAGARRPGAAQLDLQSPGWCMALCQLAVTVAGNLAVLPLTGVTFPSSASA